MNVQEPSHRDGIELLSISWTEFSIATVLILLRIYTRLQIVEEKGTWALVWVLAAWAVGICNSVFISLSVQHGMGTRISMLSKDQTAHAMMWSWVADAMSRLSVALGKVAVIAFLQDVQKKTQKRWQRALLFFIAITNLALDIFIAFILLFQCDPPRALWDESLPNNCPRRHVNNNAGFFVTAWGAFSDTVLAIYPMSIIWNLHMRLRTKLGLSALMSLGIFAAVCAAITCYQLHAVADTIDPTYVLTPLTLWGATEMWVVIIAGSFPPLWPLMSKPLDQIKSKISGQGSGKWSGLGGNSGERKYGRNRRTEPRRGFYSDNELHALHRADRGTSLTPSLPKRSLKPDPYLELPDELSVRAGSVI